MSLSKGKVLMAMLDVDNPTPFHAAVMPGLDKFGCEYAVVVVKATYDLKSYKEGLTISKQQLPICYGEEYHGEPSKSSLRYASDTYLRKVGTDIALIGQAHARDKLVVSLDVQLQVGRLSKTVRVFGNRKWIKTLGLWSPSRPIPFVSMPLLYEKAFGGEDTSHPDPTKHKREMRNPVGVGFYLSGSKKHRENLFLPNLEDPKMLIQSIKDRPKPAGFGFIAQSWSPRSGYAGTYNGQWRKEHCPALPRDFDDRFFNSGHPDLVYTGFLKGKEPVKVINASKRGVLQCELPEEKLSILLKMKGKETYHTPALDTVILEPDENRLVLVWRASVPTRRHFLHISRVKIKRA